MIAFQALEKAAINIPRYAIIGSGHIGLAIAGHFARVGAAACIANSREPESLSDLVATLGAPISAVTLAQAAEAEEAEVIILAVPFPALDALAATLGSLNGRIVIDAMNAHIDLGGRLSSRIVSEAFPGATVAKAFNQLSASILARHPAEAGGRRVIFTSSDDAAASAEAMKLIDMLGFAPIELGALDAGGRLIQFVGGALVLHDFVELAP